MAWIWRGLAGYQLTLNWRLCLGAFLVWWRLISGWLTVGLTSSIGDWFGMSEEFSVGALLLLLGESAGKDPDERRAASGIRWIILPIFLSAGGSVETGVRGWSTRPVGALRHSMSADSPVTGFIDCVLWSIRGDPLLFTFILSLLLVRLTCLSAVASISTNWSSALLAINLNCICLAFLELGLNYLSEESGLSFTGGCDGICIPPAPIHYGLIFGCIRMCCRASNGSRANGHPSAVIFITGSLIVD